MKREGMPTQRLEEKRVEEHVGEGGERERAHACKRGRERERDLAPPLICFPPPGPALCELGLARGAVSSA